MKRSPVVLVLLSLLISGFQFETAAAQDEQSTGARKVITKIAPAYPDMARRLNLTGTVKLETLVLANGSVKSVQIRGGNPLLAQAAQRAVEQWRWQKAEHDTTEQVEFRFDPQ
jgi:TonB family protein